MAFSKRSKKRAFARNVDIFGYMSEKLFCTVIRKKLILLDIMIFLDIWPIKYYFNVIRNDHRNVDIFGYMGEKISF